MQNQFDSETPETKQTAQVSKFDRVFYKWTPLIVNLLILAALIAVFGCDAHKLIR